MRTKMNESLAKSGRSVIVAATVCSLLLFLSAPQLRANDDRDKCRHRIEKAEARLDVAIRRYGEHSHEAEDRRRDLNAERDRCWSRYHAWWNGHENQWHSERDWDHDNDHHENHDRDNH